MPLFHLFSPRMPLPSTGVQMRTAPHEWRHIHRRWSSLAAAMIIRAWVSGWEFNAARPSTAPLRRCAHGVKPAADVHLGVGFAAVMPGSGRCGSLRIPAVHGKLGISTLNHEPVDGVTCHDSTDFTSEFLKRCHGFVPYISGRLLYFTLEAGCGLGVSTVNSPTCSLFTVPRRWAA